MFYTKINNMKSALKYTALIFIAFPLGALALTLPNPLEQMGITSVPGLLDSIINFVVIYIVPPVVTIFILVGAFKILTAGGNTTQFEEGKKTITYTIVGAAVVLLASGLIKVIENFLRAAAN